MQLLYKSIVTFCLFSLPNAYAEVCSSYLDGPNSTLSSVTQKKWDNFSVGLTKRPRYARNEFLMFLLSGDYRRGFRQLNSLNTTDIENKAICEEGVRKIASIRELMDGPRFIDFYNRFCAGEEKAARTLTEKFLANVGFNDYPRRDSGRGVWRDKDGASARRWLRQMIREQKFSANEWMNLVLSHWEPIREEAPDGNGASFHRIGTPGAVLALSDAVDGDFTQVGWHDQNIESVAKQLLQSGRPLRQVIRWMDLTSRHLHDLLPHLNPGQWLEDQYRQGFIGADTAERFRRIIEERKSVGKSIKFWDDQIFNDLLLDKTIPYQTFATIYAVAKNSVDRGSYFKLTVPRLKKLPEPQLRRLEQSFGRAKIRPDQVWDESKAEAIRFKATLRGAVIHNVKDFMETFTLKRYIEVPAREPEGQSIESSRLHAFAESYFEVLLERLPEFLALKPNAVDVRWLLETPIQFPVALHDDGLWLRQYAPIYRRWLIPKNKVVGRGEYLTSSYIFKLLDTVMSAYMPNVRSMADFDEVMTFRVRGAFEYEHFQRVMMNRYAMQAARIGDAKLSWLDSLHLENRQAIMMSFQREGLRPFGLLSQLRELVPDDQRSDATLMAKAVELLLSSYAQDQASVRLYNDLNNPARRLFFAEEQVSPEDQQNWVNYAQTVLLEFLEARMLAGADLTLQSANAVAFELLAKQHGFTIRLKPIANDQLLVTLRQSAK